MTQKKTRKTKKRKSPKTKTAPKFKKLLDDFIEVLRPIFGEVDWKAVGSWALVIAIFLAMKGVFGPKAAVLANLMVGMA